MPQTATRSVTRQTLKTMPRAETSAERNTRLYGCPLDHTPNAETIKSFKEGAAMRSGLIPDQLYDSVEEFLADLYA